MDLHLHLTYSSERHIHPGENTSYHNDGRLSPRPEYILPQWWKISTHSPRPEHTLPQWWTTLTQAGTHPTTMMKYFHTFTQAGTHPTTMMKYFYTFTQAKTHPTTMMKDFHTFTQAKTHPTTMMNDSHPSRNSSYHNDESFPHIHPGRNTSYHNDERLSPRPKQILPQWWKLSTLTFTQAGTHPTTMMKGPTLTSIWCIFHFITTARASTDLMEVYLATGAKVSS